MFGKDYSHGFRKSMLTVSRRQHINCCLPCQSQILWMSNMHPHLLRKPLFPLTVAVSASLAAASDEMLQF